MGRRPEATILDSPFGGAYRVDYEAVPNGTRVRHRWDVQPKNAFFGLLLPVARPLIERSLRRDFRTIAERAAKLPPRRNRREKPLPRDPYSPYVLEKLFGK